MCIILKALRNSTHIIHVKAFSRSFQVLFWLLWPFFFVLDPSAQELDCNVQVLLPPELSSGINKNFAQDMERNIRQLLNETSWTRENYEPQERIRCDLSLNITALSSQNDYQVSAQWLLARPVYASSYESAVFNHTDTEWSFNYLQGQPLRYAEQAPVDEITGLLAFYAYILIGTDADSFSSLGGTPYFQQAQRIITLVPSAGSGAWSQFGNLRNRYWLLDNLLDPQFSELREISYQYHRHGMDLMSGDTNKGRAHILAQLRRLKALFDQTPPAVIKSIWLDSKQNELISLFSEGPRPARTETFEILKSIDPSRSDKYEQILRDK